jgi:hypothetical protein
MGKFFISETESCNEIIRKFQFLLKPEKHRGPVHEDLHHARVSVPISSQLRECAGTKNVSNKQTRTTTSHFQQFLRILGPSNNNTVCSVASQLAKRWTSTTFYIGSCINLSIVLPVCSTPTSPSSDRASWHCINHWARLSLYYFIWNARYIRSRVTHLLTYKDVHFNKGRSWDSDWLRAGRPTGRSSSPGRVKNFLFSTSSRPVLGRAQPIQ